MINNKESNISNKKNINDNSSWDRIIKPKSHSTLDTLAETFDYLDLIKFFIRRDFVAFYKQTILGPIWFVIQPIINAIVFTFIFGNLANLSTDDSFPFLFYMSGSVLWSLFSVSLTTNGNLFLQNADLFGKVYFPRLTVVISNSIMAIVQFILQFIIFIFFVIFFYLRGVTINLNYNLVIILPLIIIYISFISASFGLIISSITSKYRDLSFVLSFGIQLWMFASPVVYPMSILSQKYQLLMAFNPIALPIEIFRKIIFNNNQIQLSFLLINIIISLFIFLLGIYFFNKVEKKFIDTV